MFGLFEGKDFFMEGNISGDKDLVSGEIKQFIPFDTIQVS